MQDRFLLKVYVPSENAIRDVAIRYVPETEDYTLFQCTGLKDKDGNLVWEYDRIQDDNEDVFLVLWSKSQSKFYLKNEKTDKVWFFMTYVMECKRLGSSLTLHKEACL